MTTKTIHAIVKGRVQGVFFRSYTQEEAVKYGVNGWVRNLPDGSVETLISGDSAQVDRMISWLHQGSPMSEVREVIIDKRDNADRLLQGFEIKYA
ncbi:MAG: acylphosphatase [Desulfobulbaceae bacterium]|nr:acylphosphatase [Desulfobulbaceae bacterium]